MKKLIVHKEVCLLKMNLGLQLQNNKIKDFSCSIFSLHFMNSKSFCRTDQSCRSSAPLCCVNSRSLLRDFADRSGTTPATLLSRSSSFNPFRPSVLVSLHSDSSAFGLLIRQPSVTYDSQFPSIKQLSLRPGNSVVYYSRFSYRLTVPPSTSLFDHFQWPKMIGSSPT